jgi:ABC-2 type transport system permease protein
MQGMIVVVICLLAGFRPVSLATLPAAFLFLALIAIMFTALGTAIASVLSDFQGFQLIMNFLVMPIFFLSGALFPLNSVPGPIAVLAAIDPLSYGVDGLRSTLIGVAHFNVGLDLAILAALCAAVLGLGGYLFSKIQL